MLVLSRRTDESIVLPALDISITVLQTRGNLVKIGVKAPRDIQVLRGEIVSDACQSTAQQGVHLLSREEFHEWKNHLNALNLTAQLLQRQRTAGLNEQSEGTVQRLLAQLDEFRDRISPSADIQSLPGECTSVLVVEDDDNERELLASLLRMTGCNVDTVSDGLEAVEYLRTRETPKVVLMDMQMPRCNGWEALRELQSDPQFDKLRVFVVSACSPSDYGVTIGKGCVERWFPKPLQAEEIAGAIVA